MILPNSDRLHPAPFLRVLRSYRMPWLRGDLQAGLTLAVFAVPQVLAFANLAGLPPVHGLYAAVVAAMLAALWGSAPHVNTGPTNSSAMLTAVAMAPFAARPDFLQIVFFFTLIVGVIRLLMGLLRTGHLVNFVPESAFLGFTEAIGLSIALGQTHELLGIPRIERANIPLQLWENLRRVGEANPHAVAIGGITLLCMFGLNRWAKRFPVGLFAIALAILYTRVVPGCDARLVRDIAHVPSGLPPFSLPWVSDSMSLLPVLMVSAVAVAIVGLVEAVSIGQNLAVKHRMHINFNQEFLAQGLSMIGCSFFSGMPGSGSFNRSAMLEESGGKTFVANLFFGASILLFLMTVPQVLEMIPTAAMAALLLYLGVKLIDIKKIKRVFRTTRHDMWVAVITFSVSLFIKIEYGLYTGIALAALLLLAKSRVLHFMEILPAPDGAFEEREYTPGSAHQPSAVVAVSVHGDLSYGIAHELMEQLNEIATLQDPEIIVLRVRRAFSIDFSCWNAIFDFAEVFRARGGLLFLSGIDEKTQRTIRGARAHKWIPDDQLFPATETLWESFCDAMRSASTRVKHPERISGAWRDWLDNPTVLSKDQIRDIHNFLNGIST